MFRIQHNAGTTSEIVTNSVGHEIRYSTYDKAKIFANSLVVVHNEHVNAFRVIPFAVDPIDCGCTECLTGEYVPLNQADREQIKAMLQGKIVNNTGIDLSQRFTGTIVVGVGVEMPYFTAQELGFKVGSE